MEQSHPQTTTSSQHMNLHTANIRQPISCEPCRHRKIKCSRTKPICETCRRRGCSHKCVYKGSRDEEETSFESPSNAELLKRISNLEQLLRQHTNASAPNAPSEIQFVNRIQSPPDAGQIFQLSPESLVSEPSTQPSVTSTQSSARFGVLTSTPEGDVRYEPRTSQWTSVLANTALSIATPSLDDGEQDVVPFGFPFSSTPFTSLDEILLLLPPMQQCDYLKDQYFTVFSPLFHILHDPTFSDQYAKFVEDPACAPVSWLAILFVLLSLAVTGLEEDDPILRDLARGQNSCENIRTLSRRYREAAMKCLAKQGVFWGKHNIQSLQALIMLIYAMGHSQDHTWVLLGMTYNIAVALACHIDPSSFDLNPIQCEERRRCWAGLMMLYTIQNTAFGNQDPAWKISSEVKLPSDVNDDAITLDGIRESFAGPTQMSYLLFKFQLYTITVQICNETFASSQPSRARIQVLDQQICLAQESWENRYLVDTTFEELPPHHTVHLHILHAYSHQLFLLLHRPFFAQSILGLEVPNESQIRCIASAEALLDIHKILSETPRFRPYMWYTNGLGSFHAFHAATVLAVALLMPIYKPQYQKFKRVLEQTMSRFEKLAGRSKICEKAAKILRFLLAVPSPNQTSTFDLLDTHGSGQWTNSIQMRCFTERLQPEQWLAPSTIAWSEWDNLIHMNQMDGIST
ncbi:hypothetical protein ONS95_010813 [Cadophora gregata]|uniref:uncharacterized protein n=1 Tax=Cadophora gregata TaxID=51156 RepID=UPI0026DACF74|nr:uncharacterized protein ONS95_010813 [Cadophora gregata]KAK0119361.1 hypothetical protein ONS95_010813 [Cadophora gregata]KAK0120394.1 hypothetical protein ONS96_010610 [Cadophora gregata f. sp. sojae]